MDDNIKNPQDALEWLDRSIREEAELDGEMSNEHAIQLGFIHNMLAKFPRRNCDVGSPEEQAERMDMFCNSHGHGFDGYRTYACENCKFISVDRCELAWAQMPYAENVQ